MMTTTTAQKYVRDIMTGEPVTVTGGDNIRQLARLFDENAISGLPVVDAQDRVVGVVSKTDLIHRCLEGRLGVESSALFEFLADGQTAGEDFEPTELGTVSECMNPDVVTIKADDTAREAGRRMVENSMHRLIVVDDDNRLEGIVTTLDLLRAFTE